MPVVFTLIAATLGLCAIALLVWALIGDRSKGRRRCPRCWYDLAGVPTLEPERNADAAHTRCPECGHIIRREHHTRRTRRRWRWALASLPIFALAYASLVGPAIIEQGARAAIPTLALLYGPYDLRALAEPDMYPEPTGRVGKAMFEELKRRLDEHRLRGWETGLFQSRLRGAYSRVRLLGLTATERNAIAALDTPTPLARENLSPITAIKAELAKYGLTVVVSNGDSLEDIVVNLHRLAPKTLASMLDDAGLYIDQAWTVVDRRVIFETTLAMSEHTRYIVVDLRELAPASVLPTLAANPPLLPPKRAIDRTLAFQLERALTEFVTPYEWRCNGGDFADLILLDDTMVVRARVPTIVETERFFERMRSAQGDVPTVTQVDVAGNPNSTRVEDRWYSLHGQIPTLPPATIRITSGDLRNLRRRENTEYMPIALRDHLTSLFEMYGQDDYEPTADRYAPVGTRLVVRTSIENHKRIELYLQSMRQPQSVGPPR